MKKTEQREMTNEEAVQVLMENYPASNYTMLREAVDLSVKKLEQGKTVRNDENIPVNSEKPEIEIVWNLTSEEAIEIMMKNYPPSDFTIMREAIDLAVEALKK